jgi:(2R)-3-sulfolactate dehydrogenase (NADP+)
MLAQKAGQAIPEGWALDAEGRPTTDPAAAMAGTMVPAGGAKGAAFALMVELLTAGLAGASYAFEASSLFDDAGGPPDLAHLVLVLDPGRFAPGFAGGPSACSPPSRRRRARACPAPAASPRPPPARTRSPFRRRVHDTLRGLAGA